MCRKDKKKAYDNLDVQAAISSSEDESTLLSPKKLVPPSLVFVKNRQMCQLFLISNFEQNSREKSNTNFLFVYAFCPFYVLSQIRDITFLMCCLSVVHIASYRIYRIIIESPLGQLTTLSLSKPMNSVTERRSRFSPQFHH